MDPFAVIALGALAGLVLALLLAARPGRGPLASQDRLAAGAPDDLDDMVEALNARRRRRGEAALTADAVGGARP